MDGEHMDARIVARLVNKVVWVWLWSIVVGVNSGVTYAYVSYRTEGWGSLGLVLTVLVAAGACLVAGSWFFLATYLNRCLLPLFLSHEDGGPEQAAEPNEAALHFRKRNARLLVSALAYAACALIIRILMGGLDLLLGLQRSIG